MICHGCVVWWPRLYIEVTRKEISTIQRLVCLCVTGARKSTTTADLETRLTLPPLHFHIHYCRTGFHCKQILWKTLVLFFRKGKNGPGWNQTSRLVWDSMLHWWPQNGIRFRGWSLLSRPDSCGLVRLSYYASVFQAEILAVLKLVYLTAAMKGIFTFVTYSKASVSALASPDTTSRLVRECKMALKNLVLLNPTPQSVVNGAMDFQQKGVF